MATIIADTAIVDPRAQLADGVSIGPRCVVGPDVRIGPGTALIADCVLLGRTTLGANNVIHRHVIVEGSTDSPGAGATRFDLEIGDANILGEQTRIRIASGPEHGTTRIGHRNFIQSRVSIGPGCRLGDEIQLGDGVQLGAGTIVGSHAVVDAEVRTRSGAEIGDFSVLGRYARVQDHVPSLVVAKGDPAVFHGLNEVGLRHLGCTEAEITEIRVALQGREGQIGSPLEWTSMPDIQQKLPLRISEGLRNLRTRSDAGHPRNPKHKANRNTRNSIDVFFKAIRTRRLEAR